MWRAGSIKNREKPTHGKRGRILLSKAGYDPVFLKKENLKQIVASVVFIIVAMVVFAILLSCFGIGDSANEEALSGDLVENRWISYIYILVLGPFVEEILPKTVTVHIPVNCNL